MERRYYGKTRPGISIPDLTLTQRKFYSEFLQADALPGERGLDGLESVFREVFPIKSYDERVQLEYLWYDFGEPRHTPDECRALGLTYGVPLKVRMRLVKDEPVEEDVYLGTIPLMLGGGEFIVNGAERVIVNQLQRSPGVDFSEDVHSSGKKLHTCRIIPERGSWLQVETNVKDLLTVRVDRSPKFPATCFLRALSDAFSTDEDILLAFHDVVRVSLGERGARDRLNGAFLVDDAVEKGTGEILAAARTRLDADAYARLREAGIKDVQVVLACRDEIILNTLAEDPAHSREEAIGRIYSLMRPGNPPQAERAQQLFRDLFHDARRFNFGPIGRFRLNRKFELDTDEDEMTLRAEDFYNVCAYVLALRARQGQIDDIDHLANRRVRTIKDLVMDEFRKGVIKLRRSVRERMSLKDVTELTPRTLINSQAVASSIEYFFARGELSQVVDQSNPLAQLTHERRLSALGPGGLNRKRAGFEVRDVHPSHYGRICPIETPEGTNIGLIVSLAAYASVNDYGFLVTPYYRVKDGRVTDEVVYLRADEESESRIAPADLPTDANDRITAKQIIVRYQEDVTTVPLAEVEYVDVASEQLVGVAASLIPFLEHDDANRALMGSNMQRQAVPLLVPEVPIVATGAEPDVARNSGMLITAEKGGRVEYADSTRVVVAPAGETSPTEYPLRKYFGLNERTCLNQKPIVRAGDPVEPGQILVESAATAGDELALGRNVLVAFMSWEGTNFEDAILVSQRLLRKDAFTSLHIEEFTIEVRETKLGREEITRDIPNVSEVALRNLDDAGLVCVGTCVEPGDILVGKISPKSKSELSSEEKLLHAIFGRAGEDVKNDSLEVKPGVEGYVIDVQRYSRTAPASETEARAAKREIRRYEAEYRERIASGVRRKFSDLVGLVGGNLRNTQTRKRMNPAVGDSDQDVIDADDALNLDALDATPSVRRKAKQLALSFDRDRRVLEVEAERKVSKIKRGDELPAGVLELVKVYVAVKRKLSVGDKLAGRHGNKGVVSRILPEEDMPYLADGTPVDMVLNPIGVPSRMNFGQILETHLGWAAHTLGFRAVTPVFDGAKEDEIHAALLEAGLPEDGKAVLFDGRTGDAFDQKVTVGYIYVMKLHHLVADKIHARATGPYSLITQQPLGGKARNGGQRFGEMEVWALEAYGAAHILQEVLTVKSDDVEGRTRVYESLVRGENAIDPGLPVAFEVLMNEIRGLGLNMKLEKRQTAGPDIPAQVAGELK